MTNVKINAKIPTVAAENTPQNNHVAPPTIPAVVAEPKKRPSVGFKASPKNIQAMKNKAKALSNPMFGDEASSFGGAGNCSPAIKPVIFSTPAKMPPLKSPCLNKGLMFSEIIRLA